MNRGEGAFGECPHGFSLPGYTAFPNVFRVKAGGTEGNPLS